MNEKIRYSFSFKQSVQNQRWAGFAEVLGQKVLPLKFFQRLLDTLILTLALVSAYLLRFDFALETAELQRLLVQLPLIAAMQLMFLHFCGVNNFIWRFVSLREARRILSALMLAMLPMLAARLVFPYISELFTVPLSIILLNFCLAAAGVIGLRIVRREVFEWVRHARSTAGTGEKKSVLLVGAGQAGVLTLAEIKRRGDIALDVKGFVDDDPAKLGAVINGVKVLGGIDDLPGLVLSNDIDHVIIAIAQARREKFHRILEICRSVPVKARTIPGIYELLQGKLTVSRIRDIEIGDLLGRPAVQLEEESINRFLHDKIVMVTGAGGSIGSELVRQIVRCGVKQILLVERSEFALFQIERELAENYPDLDYRALMADIGDSVRTEGIFRKFRPQVVFHAAAHKHVPMMEDNASEAIKNNVFGTNRVARLAGEFNAETFVLVSTDKAVRPKSVMGATKRTAELIIQDLDKKYPTKYAAVRFGNVIGSNGSVIPTFREQICKGGPVTVTHPEMERFFMTIPEAAQLVMQAGAFGSGGEIFILDMGEPVKILDLAKETIRLSGFEPDVDIKIVFSGIRPGEKLIEELESDAEKISKTAHPKIYLGKIAGFSSSQVAEMLDAFEMLCDTDDCDHIRHVLNSFLPEARIGSQFDQESEVSVLVNEQMPLNSPLVLTANG